jgi:hypothetical protein
MANVFSIVNTKVGEDGFIPCTPVSLKNNVTKIAWEILNSVECVRYPKYDNSYEVCLPFMLQGIVVLVKSDDGAVINKFGHYYGFSEWNALKYICKKYFKRGKSASDFKILFMSEEEYKTAKVRCPNGVPCHYFDV